MLRQSTCGWRCLRSAGPFFAAVPDGVRTIVWKVPVGGGEIGRQEEPGEWSRNGAGKPTEVEQQWIKTRTSRVRFYTAPWSAALAPNAAGFLGLVGISKFQLDGADVDNVTVRERHLRFDGG